MGGYITGKIMERFTRACNLVNFEVLGSSVKPEFGIVHLRLKLLNCEEARLRNNFGLQLCL